MVFKEREKPEYPEKNLHPITFRPPMHAARFEFATFVLPESGSRSSIFYVKIIPKNVF